MRFRRFQDIDFNKLKEIEEKGGVKSVLYQSPEHIVQYLKNDKLQYRKFPDKLYKYLPQQFAENLINNGEIRLGTFNYYQTYFDDDAQRKDIYEGIKSVPMPDINQFVEFNPEKNIAKSKFSQENFLIQADLPVYTFRHRTNFVGTIKVEVETKRQTFIHADSYLYCLSKKKDYDLSVKFNSDTCIEIFNPQSFFSHIVFHLKQKKISKGLNWGNCHYKHSLEQSIDYDIQEYMVKDYKFKDQEEYRFVFMPFEAKKSITDLINVDLIESNGTVKRILGNHNFKEIKPLKLSIPSLTNFCKIVKL